MDLAVDDRLALQSVSHRHGESLGDVIARIRAAYPDAFHTAESLCERVFVDEPLRGEPCKRFIRAYVAQKQAA